MRVAEDDYLGSREPTAEPGGAAFPGAAIVDDGQRNASEGQLETFREGQAGVVVAEDGVNRCDLLQAVY